jgi:competence protein ComEA
MKRTILLALSSACLLWCADPQAEHLPAGKGKEIVSAVCTDCHGVANIRRQRLSRDEWKSEVADMVDRGAKATDDQIDTIVDYLTTNFGPDSKLRVNTAPLVELRAVLNLTAAEAGAIVDYRAAHGDFHDLASLLQVPGVPGAKIEAKKDVLEF